MANSLDAFEQMLIDAYNEQKEGKSLHQLHPRRKDKKLLKRIHRAAKKQAKSPDKYK